MQIELPLFNSLVAKCEPIEDTLKIYHIIYSTGILMQLFEHITFGIEKLFNYQPNTV